MQNNIQTRQTSYPFSLDFFWRAISLYAIAMIAYGFIKGSFELSSITIQFDDPIVALLGLFIIGSAISLFYNWYAMREIIIGDDFISFKNRWREKKISLNDIYSIKFARETIAKQHRKRRLPVKIVIVRLKNGDRNIRFRLSSYQNFKRLFDDLIKLKDKLKGTIK